MILLLRHGETFWNRERRIQGHTESALTPQGERQAAAMARLVADLIKVEPGDWTLITSPIGRARQTADFVADATGLEPDVDHRLSEICCGEWEGQLWADISRRYPDAAGTGDQFFLAPGGETYDDVMGRASDWLGSLPPEPGRRVIAVSHGVWGRLLRGAYAELARPATVVLPTPQDAIYRLQNGQIDRFDCAPVE